MNFIESNFNSLNSHIKKYNLESNSNFIYFDKLTTLKEKSIFFLGSSVNQDRTPKDKISLNNSKYSQNSNFFDIYYAVFIPNITEYMKVLRILVDFPNDNFGHKFEILNNSAIDLNKNIYINFFLKKIDYDNNRLLSNFIFIKSEIKIITLKEIPITSKISEVSIRTKRK